MDRLMKKKIWMAPARKRARAVLAFCCGSVLASGAHGQLPSIPTGNVSVELQEVASGLNSPVEIVQVNDGSGRLFIVEQGGRIRILKNGAINPTTFLNIANRIQAGGEQGLLGLAFHPGYADSSSPGFRRFYTCQTETSAGPSDFTVPMSGGPASRIVVTEWQVSPTNADLFDDSSGRDVLRFSHPQGNHNGGKIAFRPSDGFLYIASGDGGNRNDVGDGHTPNIGNAQDTSNLLGKILRIDPLLPATTPGSTNPISSNGRYRIPSNNPFVNASGLDEIYAYGFRNPYRFSFDPVGDRLLVGDVGQGAIEEVDLVEAGKNYGWNRKEGSFLFNPANGAVSFDPNPNPAFVNPVLEYDHGDGISVIGGFVYRGSAIPALAGKYVFGDFAGVPFGNGRIFFGDLSNGMIQEARLGVNPRQLGALIKGIGEDLAGEIYLVTDSGGSAGGSVQRLIPIPATPALLNLATRGNVQTGDNILIAGFILTGSEPKDVVIRALGPSLNVNGQPVAGRLSDPTLQIQGSGGASVDVNDWMNHARSQELIDLGLAPSDPLEAAVVVTLSPGTYTAIMRGGNDATGIGLIELYDVERTASANAVNLSTRGLVQTGDDVLIGGLIVGGATTQRVIFRAIGPSLSGRGVTGALANPTLELVDSSGTRIAFNDDWRSDQATEIIGSGLAPESTAEAAIVRALAPGTYTAIVRGAGDTSGVALVEVYRLNP